MKHLWLLIYPILFLLYALLPTVNHSVDAWGFAADARFEHMLFRPHHLLYTAAVYLFSQVFTFLSTMHAALVMNALAATLSVWILSKILQELKINPKEQLTLLAIMAFSWAFWRYATENEAYILPLLSSLIATWFFIRARKTNRPFDFILSGFFASLACLFHQLHIWWWLALLLALLIWSGNQRFRKLFFWASPAAIVPLAYMLVVRLYFHQALTLPNLLHFVFFDYYAGNAGQPFEVKFLVLGFINLFRTFFQVHGSVLYLFKLYKILVIVPAIWIALMALATSNLWKYVRHNQIKCSEYFWLFLFLFLAYFLFAIYSGGNAEFMVMMPALLCMMLAGLKPIPIKALQYIAVALFLWNFTLAALPNHYLHQNAYPQVAEMVMSEPNSLFFPSEGGTIGNIVEYHTGTHADNLFKSLGWYEAHFQNPTPLYNTIDSLLNKKLTVYTDAPPTLINRKNLITENLLEQFSAKYILNQSKVFSTPYGEHVVYRLMLRN